MACALVVSLLLADFFLAATSTNSSCLCASLTYMDSAFALLVLLFLLFFYLFSLSLSCSLFFVSLTDGDDTELLKQCMNLRLRSCVCRVAVAFCVVPILLLTYYTRGKHSPSLYFFLHTDTHKHTHTHSLSRSFSLTLLLSLLLDRRLQTFWRSSGSCCCNLLFAFSMFSSCLLLAHNDKHSFVKWSFVNTI